MSKSQDIWDEVDKMPQIFEEKSALSVSFLKRALEGLLVESRKRDVLAPPYGRPEQPTPLLDLKSFLKAGGLLESLDDKPSFSYVYGFDPLQYLADYLRFLHPNSIHAMKDSRNAAIERLQFRAAHGRTVLDNFEKLKNLTHQIRSGILWGPFTSLSTSTQSVLSTVVCACRVIREGDLIVEISKDPHFMVIAKSWTQTVTDKALTQKVILSDLEPGLKYYIRCCLCDTSVALSPPKIGTETSKKQISIIDEGEIDNRSFRGPEEGFFKSAQFITLPSDEIADADQMESEATILSPVRIIAMSVSSAYMPLHSIETDTDAAKGCFVSCLLGEVFPRPSLNKSAFKATDSSSSLDKGKSFRSIKSFSQNFVDHSDLYERRNFDLHRYSNLFVSSDSPLRNSSMILAWHDRSADSDIALNEEEVNVKQYAIDMKRYKSKSNNSSRNSSANQQPKNEAIPPKMKEKVENHELTALLQAIPLDFDASEKIIKEGQPTQLPSILQLYSTSMLGPHVQIFVLDYRRGYLGKDQIAWLTESLVNSSARFKIILSGSPFGASTNSPDLIEKMDQLERDSSSRQQKVMDQLERDSSTRQQRTASNGDVTSLLKPLENVTISSEKSADPIVAVPKRSESISRDRNNSVAMLVPPPVEGDGWDKEGRLKLTLASVLVEYQKVCIQRRIEKEKEDQKEKESILSSNGSPRRRSTDQIPLPLPLEIDNEKELGGSSSFNQLEAKSLPSPLEYELESGIIILSSGACVPISKGTPPPTEPETSRHSKSTTVANSRKVSNTKALPSMNSSFKGSDSLEDAVAMGEMKIDESDVSRINDNDSIVVPYAATFDPKKTGKAFGFELCIGGGGGLESEEGNALPPVILPALGAQLVYTFSNEINPCSCSAVVTLSDDTNSLDLQLLGLTAKAPSMLFRCKIRIPD